MSSKGISLDRPGRGPGMHMVKSNEKLNNPKEAINRLLKYIGGKKGSLVLIFVFCVITTIVSILGTKLNGDIVDKYIAVGDISGLYRICIVLIGMYVVATVSTFIQNRLMVSIAQKTSADIRKDLYSKMQHLPLSYYDTHSSGDLMSRLTNDIDNINMTLSQSITQLISGVINIVGMLIAMLMLSPSLTIIGLLTVPITIFGTRSIMKYTQPLFIKKQRDLGKLNGYIEEMVSGQKAVLLFGQEENVKEEFNNINQSITKSAILADALSGCMGPLNNFINNLTYLVLAVCGGVFILKGMNITVGVVFSIILYMRNFNQPINQILNISNSLQGALAGAERVFEVMDENPEKDKEDAIHVNDLQGEVKLKDVEFSYNKDKKILNKISLDANKGQTIAIVGPTGSGKTTVINLLNKFYNIDSGTITIDGKNIDDFSMESLRKSVAVVLQDTYLFSVSVRENLRYGNLNASDEEIIKAAKLANAHHFIMQLEDGYDTVLSDNGSNLSQGQRQLLAIARAILSKSSILILDEATSSIDTRTEVEIQEAMVNLMKGKTTFIIAHRLSTIRNADKILALKDGEIIEEGNHDKLLESNGFYANLYNSQFRSGLSI
ncbi:ABC transporter ATP-binding protein [Romboutsia sp. 1001713B170207_170306_H8]|uniref:ABC transporter ATP-binding protein n=1 Tax=Romboutsia sp. 1001713B170207_170306_H8 TaxID=2787112 RepID=UPI00082059AF|nr:ABC transporter ATP-binding protein [Romboutsia sp. 1001713B170207_170306_H8]SCH18134.1 Lipid A export ATP-binding/permease protein MsbA [uncultured Clostridium sp.]